MGNFMRDMYGKFHKRHLCEIFIREMYGKFIREMYEKSHKRDVWGISLNRKTRILTKIIEFSILTLFVCLFVCL